jgi:hypothetical protein
MSNSKRKAPVEAGALKRRRSVYDGLENQKLARKKDGDQYKNSDWNADLQKQIDSPAPITGRNNEMISLASKMIWANHRLASDSEILFSFFRERYSSDVTDAEIRSTVKSAWRYNSTTREDSKNSFGETRQREKVVSQKFTKKYNPKKVSRVSRVSLEEIDFFRAAPCRYINVSKSQSNLLKAMFRADEYVAVQADTYSSPPQIKTCREWMNMEQPFLKTRMGGWVHINAVKSPELEGFGVSKSDICSFRQLLVESDTLSPEEQLNIIGYRIPFVKAVINTGNRGYHALVEINATSEKCYQEHQKIYTQILGQMGFDVQAMDYLKKIRLPMCMRNGKLQKLIYINDKPTEEPIFKDPEGRSIKWVNYRMTPFGKAVL